MNEHQYERSRANRSVWRAVGLLERAREARWLRAARQTLQTRERAARVLEANVDSTTRAKITELALEADLLCVVVENEVAARSLRQRLGWLQKLIVRHVPGVRRVRVADAQQWLAAQRTQEITDK